MPILPQEIEKALARVESQLQAVALAVQQGQADLLEQACAQLRQVSAEFAYQVEGRMELFADHPEARRRLQQVVDGMADQRTGLIRRSAQVERTLGVLMPNLAQASTYVQQVGKYRPAASGLRQYAA